MPTVKWRWLRVLLLVGALASGAAGQYWLSIEHSALRSAMAWAAAAACFIVLSVLGRGECDLPPPSDELSRTTEWALFALVTGIGIFFVVFRIGDFPPGLNHDAAWEGLYGIRILQGLPYTPYISAAWGRETLTFYFRALSIWMLGPTRLAVIAPSMAAGALILPFLYWWARNMFGVRLALVATLLLGVSGWHVIFSRTGWRSDFQPLFTTVTCCFFIRGMITARSLDFALSGLALAATVNTYNAARILPLLFPLWLSGSVMQSWEWRGFWRRYGIGLASMAVAFGVAVSPLAWYAANNWGKFNARATALEGMTSTFGALKQTLLLLNYWGNGDDFFVNTPGIEYPAAIFLVFGLLWGLTKLSDERIQFLLLGLVISALPGLVSKPNMNRNIGMMPFVYFFVALGALFFAMQLTRLVPRLGRILAAAFVVGVGTSCVYATYAQYLGPNRRDVWGYYPETTVVGQYLKTLVPEYKVWVGGANFPRDALTYLSFPGDGDPFTPRYTWLDDVTALLRIPLAAPADKGLAFVLANEGRGPSVLAELLRRYPKHQIVDLRYPVDRGQVFVKALLVPSAATQASTAAAPGAAEVVAEEPAGRLHEPRGVAVTPEGDIVVADFGNNRIQEFGRDLSVVRHWGSLGDLPGQFQQPCAVAVGPSGDVVVADTWNQRVQVFSKSGEHVREWAASFYGPRGIAIDAKGSVFVADTGNNRVVRFAAAGQKEAEWGTRGSGPGQFAEPVGIVTDAAGQVYVADNANGRLQIFTRDGKFVRAFAVLGWKSEVYSEPHIALDAKGTIWVTVPGEKEVRNYDSQGKLLRTISGQGTPGVTFERPMGIAYNPATRELIVSDLAGRLVRIPVARS